MSNYTQLAQSIGYIFDGVRTLQDHVQDKLNSQLPNTIIAELEDTTSDVQRATYDASDVYSDNEYQHVLLNFKSKSEEKEDYDWFSDVNIDVSTLEGAVAGQSYVNSGATRNVQFNMILTLKFDEFAGTDGDAADLSSNMVVSYGLIHRPTGTIIAQNDYVLPKRAYLDAITDPTAMLYTDAKGGFSDITSVADGFRFSSNNIGQIPLGTEITAFVKCPTSFKVLRGRVAVVIPTL